MAFYNFSSVHDSDNSCFVCFAFTTISIVNRCHLETAPTSLSLLDVCNFSHCGCIGRKSYPTTPPPPQSICCYSANEYYVFSTSPKTLNCVLILTLWVITDALYQLIHILTVYSADPTAPSQSI